MADGWSRWARFSFLWIAFVLLLAATPFMLPQFFKSTETTSESEKIEAARLSTVVYRLPDGNCRRLAFDNETGQSSEGPVVPCEDRPRPKVHLETPRTFSWGKGDAP